MIALVLSQADDKLLAALKLQKCKDFKLYLTAEDPDEDLLFPTVHGSWSQVQEAVVCILEPGALPDPQFVGRIAKAVKRHPGFDVYHVNLTGQKPFPRKTGAKKLFRLAVLEGRPAPLSSFVFRTERLREKAVFKADGSLDALPCVWACAADNPVRNVWRGQLEWKAAAPAQDPMAAERAVREKLELLRWTESFFGDDNYPLSVGDQLKLFATEVAKLFPSYSEEDLKELMGGFQVAQGPVRKIRAMGALKSALKLRQKELQ